MNDMIEILDPFSTSMIRAGELLQNPQPFDEWWVTEVVVQFVIWQVSYEAALDITPPPAFEDIHAHFLESLRLSSEAADDMALGMDTGDAALIDQASQKIAKADGMIDLANALLDDLRAERGG